MAAKPKTPTDNLIVISTCNLYEPYLEIWFIKGELTQVEEITNWMQCQIDAGLLQCKL